MQTNRHLWQRLRSLGFIAVLLLSFLGLAGCGAPEHLYTDESYDTVVGKWETDSGDAMQLSEDGAYWRTGAGYSEEGRYTLSSIMLPIGDSYREYSNIKFTPSRIGETSTYYYYELYGKKLNLCMYVNEAGELDPSYVHNYKRK